MFKKLFAPPPLPSTGAQFCLELVNRTRVNAGLGVSRPLQSVYASNKEFVGTLLGLLEYMVHRLGDPTPTHEAARQLIVALFGDNAPTAFSLMQSGIDSPILMKALEATQKHLAWVQSLPREQVNSNLLFMDKFFR
jgi:hypothetical protein